jgi:threonyl-tRNA synthetase
MSDIISKKSEF